jgi:hypothetical protein
MQTKKYIYIGGIDGMGGDMNERDLEARVMGQ